MSTPHEVNVDIEPLAIDGSNYDSWSAHILDIFRTMGPQFEQVVVVGNSPPNVDYSQLTEKDKNCIQLNSQASYILICALSEDIFNMIMVDDNDDTLNHDAHHIWITLKSMYDACEDHEQEQVESVSLEKCSTSATCTDSLVTPLTDQERKKIESADFMQKAVRSVSKTDLTSFHRMNSIKGKKSSQRQTR